MIALSFLRTQHLVTSSAFPQTLTAVLSLPNFTSPVGLSFFILPQFLQVSQVPLLPFRTLPLHFLLRVQFPFTFAEPSPNTILVRRLVYRRVGSRRFSHLFADFPLARRRIFL